MRKIISNVVAVACVVLLLALAASCHGATYYVANDGADDNDGTSPVSAWRTIARVNRGPLEPGDRVLLKRGDAWREQLVPHSGSADGHITYGAYGEGPKPLLLGSIAKNDPADWVDKGDSIWSIREPDDAPGEPVISPQDDPAWSLWCEPAATAFGIRDTEVVDSLPASYRVECTKSGESRADIQLYLSPLSVREGKLYRLTFRARCSEPFSMHLPCLMRSGPPYTAYASPHVVARPVSADWQTYEHYYMARVTADDARLTLYLGAMLPDGAALHIDSLSLEELDWESSLPADVGNIIFDEGASCGVKKWSEEDLREQGDYWFDAARYVVKVYSAVNPAEQYSSIELAIRDHIINQSGKSYVIYENLACMYGGAHGIGGSATHHIIVRDCDFGFIGGGDQYGGDQTVRYGNGIEFWGNAHDCLVERCRLWEIYDAALTNQSNGPSTVERNITYCNNIIWNCEYSFEYWNRGTQSLTQNVRFEHNTCINAGHGWGHTQRPDASGRHLCFYIADAQLRGIYIRNNIFYEAKNNAFCAPGWTPEQIDALVMDHNLWYQAEGVMINLKDAPYTMAEFPRYQEERGKEPHSIVAIPGLVGPEDLDLRLSPDSPCIDAGMDVGTDSDFDDNLRPQGGAPDIGAYERSM